jgi:hypothetical protein
MKYYVSINTLKAIKKGVPICDIYLPRHPAGMRVIPIDISEIITCDACDQEYTEDLVIDIDEGVFCINCTVEGK